MGQDEAEPFDVVINDDEQYSIWWSQRSLPVGWQRVGVRGSKDECLQHIEDTWTDISPRSVRSHREGRGIS